jgi:hypothetical protein
MSTPLRGKCPSLLFCDLAPTDGSNCRLGNCDFGTSPRTELLSTKSPAHNVPDQIVSSADRIVSTEKFFSPIYRLRINGPWRALQRGPFSLRELRRVAKSSNQPDRMSKVGHSRPNSAVRATSGLPPIATELRTSRIGSFVPQAEMTTKVKRWNAKQRSDRVSGAHATQQRSVE